MLKTKLYIQTSFTRVLKKILATRQTPSNSIVSLSKKGNFFCTIPSLFKHFECFKEKLQFASKITATFITLINHFFYPKKNRGFFLFTEALVGKVAPPRSRYVLFSYIFCFSSIIANWTDFFSKGILWTSQVKMPLCLRNYWFKENHELLKCCKHTNVLQKLLQWLAEV